MDFTFSGGEGVLQWALLRVFCSTALSENSQSLTLQITICPAATLLISISLISLINRRPVTRNQCGSCGLSLLRSLAKLVCYVFFLSFKKVGACKNNPVCIQLPPTMCPLLQNITVVSVGGNNEGLIFPL